MFVRSDFFLLITEYVQGSLSTSAVVVRVVTGPLVFHVSDGVDGIQP